MSSMSKLELIDILRNTEETILLELLDLSSEEIVDAFLDKIEDRLSYLYGQIQAKDSL